MPNARSTWHPQHVHVSSEQSLRVGAAVSSNGSAAYGLPSTRGDLIATLRALRRRHRSSHLEVETYTWDVLPADLRTGSKAADIAREIAFCARELAG